MYLENINSPKDIKNLNIDELNTLAKEIRKVLLKKLSIHGGHVGPNLGDVEMTIALHYVFNSPIDKFVFDVSHQSYTHKILTGRKSSFINEEDYDKVSGFSSPLESEHKVSASICSILSRIVIFCSFLRHKPPKSLQYFKQLYILYILREFLISFFILHFLRVLSAAVADRYP